MITYFSSESTSIEDNEEDLVTANNDEHRYLVFNFREKGKMATRVHGRSSRTIPQMTNEMDFTFATRSLLRGLNLLVLRGSQTNTRMIGPCDFYGPIERPHRYLYTITIDDGFPRFYRRNRHIEPIDIFLSVDFTGCSALINAVWFKGDHPHINEIKKSYASDEQRITGESLFPTLSGILAIKQESVKLPDFDVRQFDLLPFKARLVKNDTPFSIADSPISVKDSFCPVSYMFQDEYANEQVIKGGGLFLETHDFCQTMTPLDEMASGIVILGKWLDEDNTDMMLIGVRIPYGYTLIIEKGCIHGDTLLKGMYMMAMTSNHITMQTADVVFLKNRESGKNFTVHWEDSEPPLCNCKTPPPVVDFGQSAEERDHFVLQVNGGYSFYNPLTRIFNPFH